MDCASAACPPAGEADLERITKDVIAQLKSVYDPEIPVDIYELGLIYKVEFNEGVVDIEMTLTAPACPVAGEMPTWVQEAVAKVEGVTSVRVNLVFDPPWTNSMMSDEAKLELNLL
jgi:FeS assembly SUF system protein